MGCGASSTLDSQQKKAFQKRLQHLDIHMTGIDDSSIGLDLIHETAPVLSKDVAFAGSYLDDLNQSFNQEIDLPKTKSKLIELFEEFVKREKLKISLLLEEHNMHEFSRHDVMNFLSSEILDPAFANNKLVLIQSVHDNIKEFLLEVDLTKIVNFEVALSFIEKSIQKYNFKVTLRKLHNAMLDEKNTLGLFIIPEKPEIEEIHESQTKYPNLRPSPTKPEISRQPSQSPNPVKRISQVSPEKETKRSVHEDDDEDQEKLMKSQLDILRVNLSHYIKLMIFLYEKIHMQMNVLNDTEKKRNQSIINGNIYFWIVHNLERQNFLLYKYWKNQLLLQNLKLNTIFSKPLLKQQIAKQNEARNSFDQIFKFLKDCNHSADREIFRKNDSLEDIVIYRPLKEKFQAQIKIVAQDTLPNYYDRWSELKTSVQSLLCQNIENYLLSHKPIFGRVSVLDRTSFSNRKDDDFYDNMILNLAIIIVYKSTKIYAKKYNLVGDDRTETLSYFFKKVLDQMQSKNLKSQLEKIQRFSKQSELKIALENLQLEYKSAISKISELDLSIDLHLYLIFCLFMCFSGLHQGDFEEKKLIVLEKSYTSSSRLVLFSVLKDLLNFSHGFHNWRVLKLLEKLFTEYSRQLSQSSSKFEIRCGVSGVNYNREYHDFLRAGQGEKTVDKMKKGTNRLAKYLQFSMAKDNDLQEIANSFDLDRILESQFYNDIFFKFESIRKPSEPQRSSKHVFIIVTGLNNNLEEDHTNWGDMCNQFPDSEFYAFKWPAATLEILEDVYLEINDKFHNQTNFKDLFNIGSCMFDDCYIRGLDLTLQNMCKDHRSLFHVAQMSGKAMAYFLGELNIFEKCTVTLVGYSSGSIVAYNCLRDLYMMRKSEQIYNFVSIGGLLSREKLDSEVIKLFPGTFYNFFSINDPVLLYSSKIDRKLRHPVGLRSVKFDSFVEKHLRVKVRNLDLSDEVHHHSEYLTRQNIIRISKFIENQELYNYMHDRLEKTENKISPSAYEIIIN